MYKSHIDETWFILLILYILHTASCILCTVYCIAYAVYNIVHTVFCILYTASVLHTVYCHRNLGLVNPPEIRNPLPWILGGWGGFGKV